MLVIPGKFQLLILFCVSLVGSSAAYSQYTHYPNRIVVIPPIPIANAQASFGAFTVVVPLESIRDTNRSVVQPDINPVVAITYNASPRSGGVIDIRIAHSTSAIGFEGDVYDATGIPILVAVRSPGSYTINYYTRSTSVLDDPYLLRLTTAVTVIAPTNANKFAIENPQPDSYQSGIGLISGWACVPNNLSVRMDFGLPVRIPGGGERADTRSTCGHDATGFGLLINYNDLKAGQHTIRLESSDPSYAGASVSFNVALPGDPSPFLFGLANKEVAVPGFPQTGKTTTLIWQQSLQNFSIKATQ